MENTENNVNDGLVNAEIVNNAITSASDNREIVSTDVSNSNVQEGSENQNLTTTKDQWNEAKEQELGYHEQVITYYRGADFMLGQSLEAIRVNKLFTRDYSTFEDYVVKKWSMSVRRAYQLMECYKVIETLSVEINNAVDNVKLPLPMHEGQTRALVGLPVEDMKIAWINATQQGANPDPTGAEVKAEVAKVAVHAPLKSKKMKKKEKSAKVAFSHRVTINKDGTEVTVNATPISAIGDVVSVTLDVASEAMLKKALTAIATTKVAKYVIKAVKAAPVDTPVINDNAVIDDTAVMSEERNNDVLSGNSGDNGDVTGTSSCLMEMEVA